MSNSIWTSVKSTLHPARIFGFLMAIGVFFLLLMFFDAIIRPLNGLDDSTKILCETLCGILIFFIGLLSLTFFYSTLFPVKEDEAEEDEAEKVKAEKNANMNKSMGYACLTIIPLLIALFSAGTLHVVTAMTLCVTILIGIAPACFDENTVGQGYYYGLWLLALVLGIVLVIGFGRALFTGFIPWIGQHFIPCMKALESFFYHAYNGVINDFTSAIGKGQYP